ncbi:MAG: PocR ligand-binding domain-containing protein, partial [Desulfohalobiaceae bacterium]|nr:PocR ligand-binding domain-containing protein [Desulfohalobiaceae bacterium]
MMEEKHTIFGSGPELSGISLRDILDLDDLQEIQDEFALANNIASTITDPRGNPITRPSNHSEVCRIIRESERCLENCKHSGQILGQRSMETMQPTYHACHGIGFADACAPIVVQGVHVANWLMGQNYVMNVDKQRVREYALEIGVDAAELVQAFEEMPKLDQAAFERKLNFLWRMATQISKLGFKNLEYSRLIEKLRQSEQELQEHKKHLEITVEKRTRKLQETMEEVRKLSDTDALTGCYNRGYLKKHLPIELKRAKRGKVPVSIIMCDIDHFKKVNDSYGHQCGDQVLIDFVQILGSALRQDVDWIARYGGEEFLLVLPNTGLEQAERIGHRLRTAVEKSTIKWMDHTLSMTASFGASAYHPGDGLDLDVETL